MLLKNILAISGSTRLQSSNHHLIQAIAELIKDKCSVTVFNKIADLPHFNPDNDNDSISQQIIDFRQLITDSDGIIICTPEYAHGVPGSLKNAIDWTVSASSFSNKPTVLITASTDGQFGHKALLETLQVIEAKKVRELQLIISFIKTKVNADSKIIHEKTLLEIENLMENFIEVMDSELN